MDVEYVCSKYGGVYIKNTKWLSAHKIMVFINGERAATFIVPPLAGGFHFIGMVSVPDTSFDWKIIGY